MAISDPEFMTVKEVASLCKVSPMSVYRWIGDGKLRAVRIGRMYRVPSAAVRALLGGAW